MKTETDKLDHAKQNATGWTATIAALVGAMEADYERLEELAGMDAADMSAEEKAELQELRDETAVDGEAFDNADDVRERIQESALSVEVRSDWHEPGAEPGKPCEFQILLTTGGPGLRVMGELDEHGQPARAWLEVQDWGTGWTLYYEKDFSPVLLKFCECFYFGE